MVPYSTQPGKLNRSRSSSSCSASDAGSFSPHGSALAESQWRPAAIGCYTIYKKKTEPVSSATWRQSICLPAFGDSWVFRWGSPAWRESQLTPKNENYGSRISAQAILPKFICQFEGSTMAAKPLFWWWVPIFGGVDQLCHPSLMCIYIYTLYIYIYVCICIYIYIYI